jgi:hypothetical protein
VAEKLVEFFKRASRGEVKATLDDEVKEVQPHLPQAGAKNFVSIELANSKITSQGGFGGIDQYTANYLPQRGPKA